MLEVSPGPFSRLILVSAAAAQLAAQSPFIQFDVITRDVSGSEDFCQAEPIAIPDRAAFPQTYRVNCPGFGTLQGSFTINTPAELGLTNLDSSLDGPQLVLETPVNATAQFDGVWTGLPPGVVDASVVISAEPAEDPDFFGDGMLFRCETTISAQVNGGTAQFNVPLQCEVRRINAGQGLIGPVGEQLLPFIFVADYTERRDDEVEPRTASAGFIAVARYVPTDTVTISAIEPPTNEPLPPDQPLTVMTTIDYSLTTEEQAQLLVQALDQRDRVLVESSRMTVRRDASPGQTRLTLPTFTPDPEVVAVTVRASLLRTGTATPLATTQLVYGARDFSVERIELVQAIQTEDESVLMVSGKKTVARVFVDTGGRETAGIEGELSVFLGDGPTAPIRAYNMPWTAPADWNRNRENDSLNFLLPDEWTAAGGTVEVEARIILPDGVEDPNPENNTKNEVVPFAPGRDATNPFTVAYVPLAYEAPGLNRVAAPAVPAMTSFFVERAMPLADDGLSYFRLATPQITWRGLLCNPAVPANVACSAGQDRLLVALRNLFHLSDIFAPDLDTTVDQIFGWLPNGASSVNATHNGLTLGIADAPFAGGEGYAGFGLDTSGTDVLDAALTLAHEIAHNFGRRHTNTPDGCGAIDPDTNWPHANSLIQDPGFDPRNPGRPLFHPPSMRRDYMSYCSPPGSGIWTAAATYQGIELSMFEPTELKAEIPAPLQALDQPQMFYVVSGSAMSDGSDGEIDLAVELPSRVPGSEPDPNGNHCVELNGEAGMLARHCFDLGFRDRELQMPLDQQAFSVKIPAPNAAVTDVTLHRGLTQLATMGSGGNQPPTVQIMSPQAGDVWMGGEPQKFEWEGADPDGDTVTYVPQYSPDQRSWLPLDFPTQSTDITVDPAQIEAGDNVMVRVLASDGAATAMDVAGPIRVVQTPTIAADATDLRRAVVGQSRRGSIIVRNTGTGPLQITAATSDNQTFAVARQMFPIRVDVGGSAEIAIEFTPPSVGAHAATVTLTSNDAANPQITVNVTGEGVDAPAPDVAAGPAQLNFGSVRVGEQSTMQAFVENFGPGEATIVSVTTEGAGFSLGGGAAFPSTIGVQRLVLAVIFSPTSTGAAAGAIVIRSDDPNQPEIRIQLSGNGIGAGGGGGPGGSVPMINAGGVVDAASFQPILARGGIASLFGAQLGAGLAGAVDVPLPRELAGVQVFINGIPAPLFFVSAGQINFQAPFELPFTGEARISVVFNGARSPEVTARLQRFAPGIFLNPSTGEPILTRPDNSLVNAAAPARAGEVLIVFFTGLGDVSNEPRTGEPAGVPLSTSAVVPAVTLGGAASQVLFSGLAPFFIGLGQLNIGLPDPLPPSAALGGPGQGASLPLVISFNSASSTPVNLPVFGVQPPPPPPPPPPPTADLRVEMVDVLPTSALPTDIISVRYRLFSEGITGEAMRDLYLSTDAVIDPAADALLNTRPIDVTLPEQVFTSSTNNLPDDLQTGSYFVGVVVRHPEDTNAANNISDALPLNIVSQRPPFDLSVELNAISRTSLGPGEPLDVTYTARAPDLLTGRFQRRVYLSTDNVIDTDDELINTRNFLLNRGEQQFTSPNVIVPRNTERATYFIGVIVTQEGDTNPADNASEGFRLNVFREGDRRPYDIGVRLISASVETIPIGQPFDVTYEVLNPNELFGQFERRVVLSPNADITGTDQDIDLSRVTVRGTNRTVTTTVMVPDTFGPGAYFLGVVLDPNRDSNNADNFSEGIPFQVTPPIAELSPEQPLPATQPPDAPPDQAPRRDTPEPTSEN